MYKKIGSALISTALLLLVISQNCFVSLAAQVQNDQTELAQKAKSILQTNCYRCHGKEGAAEGGFNFLLDRDKLISRKAIVAGSSTKSRLFKRVASGTMPPEDEKQRPTAAEIAILKQWIEAGAPDFIPKVLARDFVQPSRLVSAIHADLHKKDEFDRRFTRYFTLTHLYNAGLREDQLQTYRLALSKLVNSLSWGRRVVVPEPIDAEKTIFRIDVRHYGWNEKVWDRIVALHPYGIIYDTDAARECSSMTKARLPYVRGDWFVAAAAKPPLYHDVLQLPKTDKELERQLRVDVAENIRQRLVIRSGFSSSGISQNNRLIERHESANGALWRSYDFSGNTDKQNIFAHPLGPNGRNGFVMDGGEIIFSLPNGLQGYMLVDAKGNRIDKGPTSIVSDSKRPDRTVVNGLSCMSCHNQGIIEKEDQIRKHVLANHQSFSKDEADTVVAIYPTSKKLNEVYREDIERFCKAVEKTGGRVDASLKIVGTDPVVALASLFEQEVDIHLAAAELGLSFKDFSKRLEQSPKLARDLGLLKNEGGTVKRDTFVASFRTIVKELDLGIFVTPTIAAEINESKMANNKKTHEAVTPPTSDGSTPKTEEPPVPGVHEESFDYFYMGAKKSGKRQILTVDLRKGQTIDLVRIKAGSFMMGVPDGEQADDNRGKPYHRVEIMHDFFLGKYEVTQGQYEALMGINPSSFKGDSRLPVDKVSWEDANAFCIAMQSKLNGKITLPTEAQWEYACRAGTTTPFHFGSKLNGDLANINGNFPFGTTEKGMNLQRLAKVGNYPPNAWGLHDMHGNVWEWCSDQFDMNFYGKSPVRDPHAPERGRTDRVLRGGSWVDHAKYCSAAYRDKDGPPYRHVSYGFRVACTIGNGK